MPDARNEKLKYRGQNREVRCQTTAVSVELWKFEYLFYFVFDYNSDKTL